MTDRYPYDLAVPPRQVPWLVRGQLLFGGIINQLGWGILAFGLIFFWIFGWNADLSSVYFSLSELETSQATVLDITATNASENDVTVFANYYSFRVERLETEYQGVSYSTGNRFQRGQVVTVEYLRNNPIISRLQGARRATFSLWAFCFASLFPLASLSMIFVGLRNGIKANRLLAIGRIGLGILKSSVPTGARVNGQPVYKLTFEFVADNGLNYKVETKTHAPHALQDEAEERLLYDPTSPAYAVMLDSLPGSPNIDEFGYIQVGSFKRGMMLFLLPIFTIVGHGIVFVFIML